MHFKWLKNLVRILLTDLQAISGVYIFWKKSPGFIFENEPPWTFFKVQQNCISFFPCSKKNIVFFCGWKYLLLGRILWYWFIELNSWRCNARKGDAVPTWAPQNDLRSLLMFRMTSKPRKTIAVPLSSCLQASAILSPRPTCWSPLAVFFYLPFFKDSPYKDDMQ